MKGMHRSGLASLMVGGLVIAAAAQAPGPQKPGPEHQRLGYFVGTWKAEGETKPFPMGDKTIPGGKMTSTDNCEWYDGRFAVICRSTGNSPMGASKSLAILSYSPEEKVYTYYATDSSGMMAMTTVPRGTVTGDTWTFLDEAPMGGQKIKSRVTLKEVSPSEYLFTMEFQGPDGKWLPMMESKNRKVK